MPDHAEAPAGSGPRPRRPLRTPLRRRLRIRLRRPTPVVRRNLSQLLCAVLGAGLGLLTPLMTAGPRADTDRVVGVLFTLGFGVISLVSIIYSVLFLVVQFSASTFTPRLTLFRDEPIVWRTFAFAIGVFVFCVTSAVAVGSRKTVSALVPGAAMILTLVALAWMRTLQMRAFDSIQLGHSLSAIAARAHRLYDTLYARPYTGGAGPAPRSLAGTGRAVRWTGPSAVLQRIDVPALIRTAQEGDVSISFQVAPGATLAEGMVIAEVTGGDMEETALRRALSTGVERTFEQDPELPFRLLADIALRALSPAVNDPATAVEALDHVEGLLVRLAGGDLDVGRFDDAAGRMRVSVPVPGWEDYVRLAVDDVVLAAAGAPMVLRRTRDLLSRLVDLTPEDRRAPVADRLRWVEGNGRADYPFVWTRA
ncbi:DUF2254 domain-containing protein [Streptomyces sp. NPDC003456]|uniref:DUF2254 domain-containing protein n=1 Tax=Streptomyces sp. NPDC003456 TaxID=3364683 RepID=UPI0036AE480E